MKTLRNVLFGVALWVGFFSLPLGQTGCTTTQQATTYKTLDAVGQTAKASLDASTALLKQGSITVAQWQKIANAYDLDFQPAYNLAVLAAGSTAAPAPPTLVAKQAAITASVDQLKTSTAP